MLVFYFLEEEGGGKKHSENKISDDVLKKGTCVGEPLNFSV